MHVFDMRHGDRFKEVRRKEINRGERLFWRNCVLPETRISRFMNREHTIAALLHMDLNLGSLST
jgi:hypothetical protein